LATIRCSKLLSRSRGDVDLDEPSLVSIVLGLTATDLCEMDLPRVELTGFEPLAPCCQESG
jgi:hypothetical protein